MTAAGTLTATVRNIVALTQQLETHRAAAKAEDARLCAALTAERTKLSRIEANLDVDQIRLAEQIIDVNGTYTKAGEQSSVVSDARDWFAGENVGYLGLRHERFATKNYDRWSSQRHDSKYGRAPRHGSTNFSVGLTREFRGSGGAEITDTQREAAIYYLTHLEAIQRTRVQAAA